MTTLALTGTQRNALRLQVGQVVWITCNGEDSLATVCRSPYRVGGPDFTRCNESDLVAVTTDRRPRRLWAIDDINIRNDRTPAATSTFDPFAETVVEDNDGSPPAAAYDPAMNTNWTRGEDEGDSSWYTEHALSSRANSRRVL